MTEFLPAEELSALRQIAADWLIESKKEFDLSPDGFVTIFDGKVSGWKKDLLNPETELAGSYAVASDGSVFLADGYDAFNGANRWIQVEELPRRRSLGR